VTQSDTLQWHPELQSDNIWLQNCYTKEHMLTFQCITRVLKSRQSLASCLKWSYQPYGLWYAVGYSYG